MLADALARLPNARREGSTWRAPCPAHGGRDRNLSVWAEAAGIARFKCWSHGCSTSAIVAALGRPWTCTPGLRASNPRPSFDDAQRTQIARRIWRGSEPAVGTLAEAYLRSRDITMSIPPTVRFHHALKHPSEPILLPAMVAAVSDLNRNLVAVHRTFLDAKGSKTTLEPSKATLGPIAGRAVHLAPAGEKIALAEGIETALSVQQATGIPAWAALGTSNLARIDMPHSVREVIIAADNDGNGAGEKAALAAAARFAGEGRRVRIAKPATADADFNDVLRI